jgi:invasin B
MAGMTTDRAGVDRTTYSAHEAMAEMASGMSRLSGDVANASQKAAQALFAMTIPVDGENANAAPGNDLNTPLLSPPATPLTKSSFSGATLTLLLGELSALLGKDALTEWTSNAAMRKEAVEAHRQSLVADADEFGDAVSVADAAVAEYGVAKEQFATAKTALASAEDEARAAEAELQSLENDDPARPQALHKSELAQKTLQAATQKYVGAVANERQLSADALQKVRIATDIEMRVKADAALSPLRRSEQPDLSSSAARLSLAMAELSRMIGDGAEKNQKADQEIMKQMQMERQKVAEKSAAEYDAEVQKAEHISKTMGCIGKIIGGLILAVSIMAIPFTGGASLALAVIGVGLTIADTITTAATGKSLTEMALSPVTKLLQKLVEIVGKAIGDALEAAGVPADKAQMIGGIVAAIAVAVVMIAVMIGVAVAVRGPAVAKLFQSFAKSGAKMLAKVTQQTAKKVTLMADVASSSLKLWGEGIKGYGDVATGVHTKNAAQARGKIELSSFTIQQIERYLQDAAENFGALYKTTQQLTAIASNAMQAQTATGHAILRNVHA